MLELSSGLFCSQDNNGEAAYLYITSIVNSPQGVSRISAWDQVAAQSSFSALHHYWLPTEGNQTLACCENKLWMVSLPCVAQDKSEIMAQILSAKYIFQGTGPTSS